MKNTSFVVVILFTLLTGCKKDTPNPDTGVTSTQIKDLINQEWVLEHYNYQGVKDVPPSDFYLKYIKFSADSTFVGYTGCDVITGIYHATDSGSIFFFSLLNSSGAPCPPGTGKWHDIMSNQLLASKSFYRTYNRLKISASDNDTINQLSFIPRNP